MGQDYRKDYREFERDYFWTFPRVFVAAVLGLTVACAIGFALNVFGLASFGFFAPKYEHVRRTTFEQSQAYVEGQRRDIQNLRMDWLEATGDRKAAIRSVALQRINGLPEAAITPEVERFRAELMGGAQ